MVPVSIDRLLQVSQQLNRSTEALAALGAYLRIRSEDIEVDPALAQQLSDVVQALGIDPHEDLDDDQAAIALGFVRAFFSQASGLLADPARTSGWTTADPELLQSQGRASTVIAKLIHSAANSPSGMHGLIDALSNRGARICDIGTGVGLLAIKFAELFPNAQVLGIDIWEPSLALARQNVAGAGVADRVTVQTQDATELAPSAEFDLTFVPAPFLPRELLPTILRNVQGASTSGGWCVLGLYALPDADPLARALTAIRVTRSGGHQWTLAEAQELLTSAGFVDVHLIPRTWEAPTEFVVGRRAD